MKFASFSGRWRRRFRILGDNVPAVDVFLPVCNEALDIIQDTVRAALAIDYPPHRFRVIVSDDGGSAQLKTWVEQFASGHPNLYYTARTKQGHGGYKAGNLNHTIRWCQSRAGGPAEFLACLDADMIPEKKWLRSVLPHIVRDLKVGMVCPTQVSA